MDSCGSACAVGSVCVRSLRVAASGKPPLRPGTMCADAQTVRAWSLRLFNNSQEIRPELRQVNQVNPGVREMSMIVAGNFTTKIEADSAIEALLSGGIGADHVCVFAINPPGQHDSYPIGGDEDESRGSTEAGEGALKGAAIGGAIGLGAGIVAGPVGMDGGAAVGAYVGSFAGAWNRMDDADVATESRGAAARRPPGGRGAAAPGLQPGRESGAVCEPG